MHARHLRRWLFIILIPFLLSTACAPLYAMKDTVMDFKPHPSATNQWWNTVWAANDSK